MVVNMSVRPGQVEQPSAAKPRDLKYDLASAAQHSTKKRKTDDADQYEAQADRERVTAREPLSTDVEHSIGQSARPPTRHVSAARPETAQHRRASYGQPTALEYLANKGSKIQAIEAELATAQAANMTLNQQVEKLSGTVHTQTNKLAILQGGKDFLTSERARERLDIEHQLSQSEHNILTLNQSLRRSEQAKAVAETRSQAASDELATKDAEAADLALHHRQQLQQLQHDLDLAQHNAQQAEQQKDTAARRQQQKIEATVQQITVLEQQLAEVVREAELYNQQRIQAEDKSASLQLQMNSGPVTINDDSILLQNLRNELAAQSADVVTARRLKDRIRNTEVLQEQLHVAQARAKAAEQRAAEADQLSEQLAQLQSHQQTWDKVLQGLPDAQTPENVLDLLDSLQTQLLKSTERLGELAGQHAEQTSRLEQATRQQNESATALEAQKSAFQQLNSSQSSLQRRVDLISKERDSLKQLIGLYQDESGTRAASGDADGTPQRAAQVAHIAQLEEAILGLQAQHQQLQSQLAEKESLDQGRLQQLASAKELGAKAEEHVKELQKILEDQNRELIVLQEKLGKGEFNKATTKVLHFKRNPEAVAVEKLEHSKCSALEAENAALKGQLQKLEHQSASAAGSAHIEAGSVDSAVKEAQISVLQRQIADLEKAKTRLTQVFRSQVSSFREAVYQMFGYQVDVAAEAAAVKPGKAAASAVYTLKPQHADDAHARFQFRMNVEQQLDLVPNKYVQSRLQKEVETFIDRFHSIPAFTANYTMEQFQKQTQC